MPRPLLSVCLPTFNRAEKLRSALTALIPQINALHPRVELLVSDNHSTDHTPDVIAWAGRHMPLRHRRNERNEGGYGNLYRLTSDMAQGEYIWFIGDDDLVRPDGLARIVATLEAHPHVDFMFVNITERRDTDLALFDRPVTGHDFPDIGPTRCADLAERELADWRELIDPRIDSTFLGSMQVSVFRLDVWQPLLDPDEMIGKHAEIGYHYAVLYARGFAGRPAYYLGYPALITFFGHQEWMSYRSILVLVHTQNLLDLYRRVGVSPAQIRRCRADLLPRSLGALRQVLAEGHPGNPEFRLWRFVWQNRRQFVPLSEMLYTLQREKMPLPLLYYLSPLYFYAILRHLYSRLPEPIKQVKQRVLGRTE